MAAEENKAIMRRFHEEVFNKRNAAFGREVTSPSYVVHDPSYEAPGDLVSQPSHEDADILAAIPDFQVTVDDQVAESDRVVTRCTLRGTFTAAARTPWGVFEPTGKKVALTWISIDRLVDGKIVEAWHQWDLLGLFLQLGIVSLPERKSR